MSITQTNLTKVSLTIKLTNPFLILLGQKRRER